MEAKMSDGTKTGSDGDRRIAAPAIQLDPTRKDAVARDERVEEEKRGFSCWLRPDNQILSRPR